MATADPANLDSRLSHKPTFPHPQATYRVQGHAPIQQSAPRLTYQDILKMPKGSRPKPNKPCWTCKDLNKDPWHWRVDCPYQRDQAQTPKNNPRFTNQRAPNAAPNRAPAQQQQHPNRSKPPFGPSIQPTRPRHRIRRRGDHDNPDLLNKATALIGNMSMEDRRQFLVDQAKALEL